MKRTQGVQGGVKMPVEGSVKPLGAILTPETTNGTRTRLPDDAYEAADDAFWRDFWRDAVTEDLND